MANGDKIPVNGRANYPIAVAVIGAMLGSSGTVALVFGSPIGSEITRPDPFTGTQAAVLEDRIKRLEQHIVNHPYDRGHDRRITALEIHYEQIIQNQERILDRLDALD